MYIRETAFVQPSRWVEAEDVEHWTASKPGFITSKIGNSRRAYLNEDETGLDLCIRACNALFEKANQPSVMNLLIVVTQNPDYKLPHMSALLQDGLALPDTTACFDIGLGCSGFIYALKVAEGFLSVTGGDNALIVTCDPYSRVMAREDKETVTIFGDAAAAVWVSRDYGPGAAQIGEAHFGTDGSGAEHLIVKNGGAANPLTETLRGAPTADTKDRSSRLHMNGRAILEFMMTRVPSLVDDCLQKNRLTREDIDFFVFHQASKYMLQQLIRRMELPPEKVPIFLDTVANTVSSTIPIVIDQLPPDQDLDGKRLVLCGFGVGLSWGAVCIQYRGP